MSEIFRELVSIAKVRTLLSKKSLNFKTFLSKGKNQIYSLVIRITWKVFLCFWAILCKHTKRISNFSDPFTRLIDENIYFGSKLLTDLDFTECGKDTQHSNFFRKMQSSYLQWVFWWKELRMVDRYHYWQLLNVMNVIGNNIFHGTTKKVSFRVDIPIREISY